MEPGRGFPDRLYQSPRDIITCTDPDDLAGAITAMEDALDAGYHLAGWISYEAGYGLEPRLKPLAQTKAVDDLPLVWMGVFDGYTPMDRAGQTAPRHPAGTFLTVDDIAPDIGRGDFDTALARIHEYLLAGDVYQINYTFPLRFTLHGTPGALYRQLKAAQPVGFAAHIETATASVLSLSPELFIAKTGDRIVARPMKGTAARGRTWDEDNQRAGALAADPKSRAENLMIVDLLRNDLSRVARDGSVDVSALFDVERYRTLLQMTSTVTATVDETLSIHQILTSLFPCGSVTGAPKIRAMEIIHALEHGPRGPYTGAIGCITPDRDFTFSVPIRTLTLRADGPRRYRGSLGIGAGIVADSVTAAEYEECLLKARFLTAPLPEFDLIETIRWSADGGYSLLDGHMARLQASARYFGFALNMAETQGQLAAMADTLDHGLMWRVRLVLSTSGALAITAAPMPETGLPQDPTIALSNVTVQSDDPLLFHKTTARTVYSRALDEARARTGCFDAILCNERGELTEGSFTNLFVDLDGQTLTPPLSSGLLPGVLRADLLIRKQAIEAVLTPADLARADRIRVGNAVRGLVDVRFIPTGEPRSSPAPHP